MKNSTTLISLILFVKFSFGQLNSFEDVQYSSVNMLSFSNGHRLQFMELKDESNAQNKNIRSILNSEEGEIIKTNEVIIKKYLKFNESCNSEIKSHFFYSFNTKITIVSVENSTVNTSTLNVKNTNLFNRSPENICLVGDYICYKIKDSKRPVFYTISLKTGLHNSIDVNLEDNSAIAPNINTKSI